MSYQLPKFRHPDLPVNALGYTRADYEGSISTLCAGCGHDSISGAIVRACHELALEPHKIAKLSGIGCSSKSPTYFLGKSHGFNSVHGRMPSVVSGANMANRDLLYLGVSGDGDTASIGMGQFAHAVRRNLNMVYIVMNNGCYGLTKGQDSATADAGSASKKGDPNPFSAIDLPGLALQLGATFVARSFSGDKGQLVPLIKAAISHRGFALIDVISPCVTFNNNPGSTKSYDFVREHAEATGTVDFVPMREEITASYPAGRSQEVTLHDGSVLHLEKLAPDLDPFDRVSAMVALQRHSAEGQILTGLIYMDKDSRDLHDIMETSRRPLNSLVEEDLCPGDKVLANINASLR
ncbi:MAG: 2-oxoglutarate ferredoxin oxidoreductase subunit beta [Haliea sp.]|jgi:2-oxoglutarate ferredoxin oxidoreductase subunit beta|uniref:2-oxoacid:ferredoxin oxidoreductase subunit beta n=1 Tax=Haliea sp. TaxID=1932666 RepID=UPI000C5E744E|nr:2-oxoacid:ferredoxin oxidoreductase subunit beta [Haliea sp.]MBM69956.1 2-oxoglutarate ferredoxin oxidoreductase subunit beta [Haliea sp.]|tara:strand:- start:14416 stop:15468 length:1053 start_codon:yes stop_codon:yes gene_type:complete